MNMNMATITLLLLLLQNTRSSASKTTTTTVKLSSAASKPFIGVNVGTDLTNLLSPTDLTNFLTSQHITHIRLYDAPQPLLSALSKTDISVIIGIPNSDLIALASSSAAAENWVSKKLLPFSPSLKISAIAVGDETTTNPSLLPAIRSISAALSAANLSSIPVSTPLPFSVVQNPFPPSQAFFNQSLVQSLISPLLQFLKNNSSPLMLNLYPYYAFMQGNGVIPVDNALFKPLPPALEEVDPNTLLHYVNVYDAMIDAVHFSMRNLNVSGVSVLVTESGWPSYGEKQQEPYATKEYASVYNSNLIKHVLDRSGTPLYPEVTSSVYIYELFNEDLRPGPVSEKNWGLFYGNGTPVYLLHVSGSGGFLANDTTNRTYCVAAEGADRKALQAALDWACGPGRANCSEIQPGESCYEPNEVENHASYAFDSYYQMEGRSAGSCYFQGVAMVTTTDPSHGNCIFPGSKQASTTSPKADANATQSSRAERLAGLGLKKGISLHHFPILLSILIAYISLSYFWT